MKATVRIASPKKALAHRGRICRILRVLLGRMARRGLERRQILSGWYKYNRVAALLTKLFSGELYRER